MSTLISSPASRGGRAASGVGPRFLGFVVALGLLLATAAVLHVDGVRSAYLVQYAAYLLWGLALPGFLVRRTCAGPARTWFAEIVLSLTVGVVLELIAWAVLIGLHLGSALWAWPAITVPLLLLKSARARVVARPRERMTVGVLAAVGSSLASLLWMCHRQALSVNPLPGHGSGIYQDLLWHMGLVHEAQRSFPLKTPQVVDAGTLHYHWYSDAHMAVASLVARVPVPVEEERFFPVLFFFLGFGMTVVVIGEVVRRASAMSVAAILAAATTTFMPFPHLYLAFSSYIADSPSQLFAVPFTLAFLLFVHDLVQGRLQGELAGRRTWGRAALVLLILVGLSGAKASAPPSVLGGMGLLWLWSMTTRKVRAVTTLLLGVCVVATGVALTVVAGGDAGSGKQLLAPLGAAPIYRFLLHPKGGIGWALPGSILPGLGDQPVLLVGLLGYSMVAAAAMWVCLGLGITRRGRRDPFTWLVGGTLIASMLAFYVINHPGLSELYFMRGALPVGIVGLVYQGSSWWEEASEHARRISGMAAAVAFGITLADLILQYPKRLAASDAQFQLRISVVVLVVVALLVLLVSRVGQVSALALGAALVVGTTAAETVYQPIFATKSHIRVDEADRLTQAAGLWVEKHVPDDALMATNQHCLGREALVCGSMQWWLSGIGGRRVLIDGWSYTPKSANRDPFFEPDLLAMNQKAFTDADPQAVQTLRNRGVRYLVAVKGATPLSPGLGSVGKVVYANARVKIYALP